MSRIVMVTGGSRGIGAAAARLAAELGYDVCVNYNSNRDAAEAVAADVERAGQRALVVQADTSKEADVLRLFTTCDQHLGTLDALINNAGIVGHMTRMEDMEADAIDELFGINVRGYFLCAREAVRRMSTKHGGKGGTIVNTSSAAAYIGGGGEWIHYAASKGATDTMTLGLAKEVAKEGIRVNAVQPGLIETEIHATGMANRLEIMTPMVPMARTGTAEEVADVILWLCSEASSYVTGALVPVSGGR